LATGATSPPTCHDHVRLEQCKFSGKLGKAPRFTLGETIFDNDIAALEIAEITQPVKHEFDLGIGLRRAVQQNPEARNPRQLLRARNLNSNNRSANKRYKFTS